MYIIIIIDPLSQPGCYDIIKESNLTDIVNTLKRHIKNKLDTDTDFLKVGYNKQIIDENYKKYCEYIDTNISNKTDKFRLKYYGYYRDQSYQHQQYDILYNIHNLS